MNKMISDEVKETRGRDLTSINDTLHSIEEETNEEVVVADEVSIGDEKIITEEYFNKIIDDMKDMNFVEISKMKKDIKKEIESLKQLKEMAEGIKSMEESINKSIDDNNSMGFADAIALNDAKSKFGSDDIDSFLDSYDETVEKMNKLLEKAEEAIHTFDDVNKTTTFLTNSMLQILDKNIARLEEKEKNGENASRIKKYYNSISNIFSNREDITFIKDKICSDNRMLHRLSKDIKKDRTGSVIKNVQKKVSKEFCAIFNVNQMNTFEKYLKDLFQDDQAAFILQYELFLIYRNEHDYGKYGNHKWVEVLIMNVLDIVMDSYDLDGGKEAYDEKLLELKETVNVIMR